MTRRDEVSEQARKIVAEIVDGAIHETVFIDDVKDMMTECLVAVIADRAAERLGCSHLTGDTGDLTPEQLQGMDLWDRDVMLSERHRAAGAMLVRMAVREIRRRRAHPGLSEQHVREVVEWSVREHFRNVAADWADLVAGGIAPMVIADSVAKRLSNALALELADTPVASQESSSTSSNGHLRDADLCKVTAERDAARRRVAELEAAVERMAPVVRAAEWGFAQLDPVVKVYREKLCWPINTSRGAELEAAVERMIPVVAAVGRWFDQEGDGLARAVQRYRDKLRGPR